MAHKTKEARAAYHKAYRETNLERIRVKKKEYRETASEKIKAYAKAYRESSPTCKENNNRISGERLARQREGLETPYILRILIQGGFPKEAITPELIELKRITLKTTRLCHQLKN